MQKRATRASRPTCITGGCSQLGGCRARQKPSTAKAVATARRRHSVSVQSWKRRLATISRVGISKLPNPATRAALVLGFNASFTTDRPWSYLRLLRPSRGCAVATAARFPWDVSANRPRLPRGAAVGR
jgi:hypothetical protein